jgi:DNA-binding NarL/FixJ family response regulator
VTIRVLLIDDHAVVRDGLAALLASQSDLVVVGGCGDGLEGLRLARELAPDVVVLDVTLPGLNGIEVARQLAVDTPSLQVCALTMHSEARFVRDMIDAGAAGYVTKSAPFDAVIEAIRSIAAGGTYLSDEARAVLGNGPPSAPDEGPVASLSPRERQVLQLIAEGASSKRAAAVLGVTKKTVDHHRQSVMRKLGLFSVSELTKFAIRHGLTPMEGEWSD